MKYTEKDLDVCAQVFNDKNELYYMKIISNSNCFSIRIDTLITREAEVIDTMYVSSSLYEYTLGPSDLFDLISQMYGVISRLQYNYNIKVQGKYLFNNIDELNDEIYRDHFEKSMTNDYYEPILY